MNAAQEHPADALLRQAREIGKLSWLTMAARAYGCDIEPGQFTKAALFLAREGVTFSRICQMKG